MSHLSVATAGDSGLHGGPRLRQAHERRIKKQVALYAQLWKKSLPAQRVLLECDVWGIIDKNLILGVKPRASDVFPTCDWSKEDQAGLWLKFSHWLCQCMSKKRAPPFKIQEVDPLAGAHIGQTVHIDFDKTRLIDSGDVSHMTRPRSITSREVAST